ncbi:MAG: ABC transporter substrate-binding protein [Actinomycetota bacterium]|nr:ABC transporter substrate-binding protein [Actinomycetota bacterium]
MVRTRRNARTVLATALIVALAGCAGGGPSQPPSGRGVVRVASYDFSENEVLAEVYGQALRRKGFRVTLSAQLGTREIVEPALEQGHLDLVIDYLGTALDFASPGDPHTHGDSATAYQALRTKLAPRGIDTLGFAQAQDQNGFAVTAQFARQHGLSKISDLVGLSASLVFGGPPECPNRPYCLPGLERAYGLRFRSFLPMPTRIATATALTTGEISVGLLETTDARLADGQLRLLADDRGLQPRENIVPLVRRDVMKAHGSRVTAALAHVTAVLTTRDLIELNRAVEVDGLSPAQAATQWLARLPKR